MLKRSESNIIEKKTGVSKNECDASLEVEVSRPGGVNPQVADKNLRPTDLRAFLGGVRGAAQRCQDVVGVLAVVVTGRRIIAHGEGQGRAGVNIAQTVAHHGSTADVGSILPDDLREVTPFLELGHGRVRHTVGVREVVDFVVVHQVGDHHADFVLRHAVSDVLTVATTVDGTEGGHVSLAVLR